MVLWSRNNRFQQDIQSVYSFVSHRRGGSAVVTPRGSTIKREARKVTGSTAMQCYYICTIVAAAAMQENCLVSVRDRSRLL